MEEVAARPAPGESWPRPWSTDGFPYQRATEGFITRVVTERLKAPTGFVTVGYTVDGSTLLPMQAKSAQSPPTPDPTPASEASLALLERARAGDREALECLIVRYLTRLRRWASGRAPAWARHDGDTDDFVQEAVLGTLKNINGFVPKHDGALLGYLREAVLNRIRDRVRRRDQAAPVGPWIEQIATETPSPLDSAIGRETLDRYEAALARLTPDDRALIVARVELGQPYEEIAPGFGKPTVNAARVAFCRALARLAREMRT